MQKLKAELAATDILAMLPALGTLARSKEELDNLGDVVGAALAKFCVMHPEAADFLSIQLLQEAFKDENTLSCRVILRAVEMGIDDGFLMPLE